LCCDCWRSREEAAPRAGPHIGVRQHRPDTLERWLGQRKEIAALRCQVAELRREIETMRGVRNGARRGNGVN